MKKPLLVLSLLALAGCATTAPSTTYRSAGQVEAWRINGEYSVLSNSLSISINGKKIIDDTMWPIMGNTKEFNTTFDGKPVTAECEYKGGYSRMHCQIFVANERATTLNF